MLAVRTGVGISRRSPGFLLAGWEARRWDGRMAMTRGSPLFWVRAFSFCGVAAALLLGAIFWTVGGDLPGPRGQLVTVYRGIGHGGLSHVPDPEVPGKLVRDGQNFHPEPLEVTPAMREALEQVLKKRGSYEKYQPKKCGDFHADFETVWQVNGSRQVRVQVCLTCGDARCYGSGDAKEYSLSEEGKTRLREAWEALGLKD